MFPNREMAEKELEIAGQFNQGPRTEHSIYDILPNVKETTFIDAPLWKPLVK